MPKTNKTAKSAPVRKPAKAALAKRDPRTDSIVKEVISANNGQDTLAVLNSGAKYTVTKYLAHGVNVKVGDNFPELTKEYERRISKDNAARNAKPKGPAVLAKGAETEVHSRKAAADSRKGAPTKADKKTAPKAAKNKQPSRGADRDYTRGKTEIKAAKDSWRYHMLTMITKATNTAKAKAAHEKSGKFSGNKLDFNWAAAQGYIVFAK